jgi:hypothetical protein
MLTDAAKKIAEEAKRKGMWLYEPKYRCWYSPEEFMHIYHYVDAKDEFLKTLQIRHPSEGIEAGFKRLAEVQVKLQGLIKMVMRYYNK